MQRQYIIQPDAPSVIKRAECLDEAGKQAIAVCNYHPIDCASFDPSLQEPHYRRQGRKHPFFEGGYTLDVSNIHVDLDGEIWEQKASLYILSDRSLNEFKAKVNKKHVTLEQYKGNIIASGEYLFYFNGQLELEEIGKDLLNYSVISHRMDKKKGENKIDLTYEEFKSVFLGDEVLAKKYFTVRVHVSEAPLTLKMRKFSRANEDSYYITVNKEAYIQKIHLIITRGNHRPFLNINQRAQLALKPGCHFLSIDEMNEKVIHVCKGGGLDPRRGKVLFYSKDNHIVFRYKDCNNEIRTDALPKDKSSYFPNGSPDMDLILQDLIARVEKYLLVGNHTYKLLKKEGLINEGEKDVPANLGLNHIAIGGEKIIIEGIDERPVVSQEEYGALRKLEDMVLIHKTGAVNRIASALYDVLRENDKNAVIINKNQLEAQYPAIALHLDMQLASYCTGISMGQKALAQSQPDLNAYLGKYYLYKTKPNEYSIQYVSFRKGKATLHNVKIKPDVDAATLSAVIDLNMANGGDIDVRWLKEYLEVAPDELFTVYYAELLTHLLMAFINHELYQNKLGMYFDRRSSFGFLFPTATEISTGIRLSLGLVPNDQWETAVVQGTIKFNDMMMTLLSSDSMRLHLFDICDYFGDSHLIAYGHKIFLDWLISNNGNPAILFDFIPEFDDPVYVQRMVKKYNEPGAFQHLSEELSCHSTVDFSASTSEFQLLYSSVNEIYEAMFNIMQLECPHNDIDVNNTLYHRMIALRDKIDDFRYQSYLAIQAAEKSIDISSESENSDEEGDNKKHYTTSGMSALSLPLVAYKHCANVNGPINIHLLPYMYFEVDTFKKYFSPQYIQVTQNQQQALIMYYDNNPCVTGAQGAPISITSDEVVSFLKDTHAIKLFVADVTSSTSKQKDAIIQFWKDHGNNHILCFAESALKNRQLSLDMAHYGIIKIVCNDTGNELYQAMKAELRRLSEKTSSFYAASIRRILRQAAAQVFAGTENKNGKGVQESEEGIEEKAKKCIHDLEETAKKTMQDIEEAVKEIGEKVKKTLEDIQDDINQKWSSLSLPSWNINAFFTPSKNNEARKPVIDSGSPVLKSGKQT